MAPPRLRTPLMGLPTRRGALETSEKNSTLMRSPSRAPDWFLRRSPEHGTDIYGLARDATPITVVQAAELFYV